MEVSKMRNYNSENCTRKCKKCDKWLVLDNFKTRVKILKSGEKTLNYREICNSCSLKKLAEFVPTLEGRRAKHKRNPIRVLLNSARSRARKLNLDFNIDKNDLTIPLFCPLLGTKIEVGVGKHHPNSPSIDRIDNSKGYTKGNVMILSYKANTCKNSLSLGELKTFANNLLRVLNKLDELREQPEVVNPDLS